MAKLTSQQLYENINYWCDHTDCDMCPLGSEGIDACDETHEALDEYVREEV